MLYGPDPSHAVAASLTSEKLHLLYSYRQIRHAQEGILPFSVYRSLICIWDVLYAASREVEEAMFLVAEFGHGGGWSVFRGWRERLLALIAARRRRSRSMKFCRGSVIVLVIWG